MDTAHADPLVIRGLQGAADAELEAALRAVLGREDELAGAGTPV